MYHAELYLADSREALAKLPDNSVDSIVTDPPYELNFMNRSWDASGISYDPAFWAECLRVLKHGGHMLAFGGSRTFHRIAVAIEDGGFEIRDTIMWLYSSGFPKGNNLKPAYEPIALARKALSKGLSARVNVEQHGTGKINIEQTRIGSRHPANVLFSHTSACVQAGTKEVAGYVINRFDRGAKPWGNAVGEPYTTIKTEPETVPVWSCAEDCPVVDDTYNRYFFTSKASVKEKNTGLSGGIRNTHPTVKPLELMRYLVRLVTPPDGIVLDPFMGSGTTGCAAIHEGFRFIGIDNDAESHAIASARVGHAYAEVHNE